MDYQSMQPMSPAQPAPSMPPMQPMGQEPSTKLWWVVGGIVVLAVAGWYFFGTKAPATGEVPTDTQASAVDGTQLTTLTDGNTTADISADLNATPDTSSALDADAAASAQVVQEL